MLLGSPPPGASAVDACAPWPLAIEPALAAVLQALGTEDRTIVAAPTPPQPLPPSATPQPFLPPARALPRLATPAVGARRWQTPIQPGKDRK